ncbi:MAG: hypothetical protein DRO52_05020 [Candidatus Hecatellales archaeon]|nr:MAG: hypothetical protein DRO52_05020 [Candidatus Hecatellales archaeon]
MWVMDPEVAKEFEKETGIKLEYTVPPTGWISSHLIATKGEGWDVGHTATMELKPILYSPYVRPIPVSKISRWTREGIFFAFHEPDEVRWFGGEKDELTASQFKELLWKPGEEGKTFLGVPIAFSWDAVGYNPEYIPYTEEGGKKSLSFGEILKKDWKGRAGIRGIACLEVNSYANFLYRTGQFKPEVRNNLKPEEVDFVVDYLIPYMKEGHFVAFWGSEGEGATLFSTREMWISNAMTPAVMAVRRAGVPCSYAMNSTGIEFWYTSDFISVKSDRLDAAYKFIDFRLSPWWTDYIYKKHVYTTPSFVAPDVKPYMGVEFYDWAYMGKATYKPTKEWFKEMWPEKGEVPKRIADSLFLPEKYKWSKKEGKPHPEGKLREQGSVKDRIENTGFMLYWADYGDYYVEAWSKLRTYMPK